MRKDIITAKNKALYFVFNHFFTKSDLHII